MDRNFVRIDWNPAADFTAEEKDHGVTARVYKSSHTPFPRYRFQVGFKDQTGFFHQAVAPRVFGQNVYHPTMDFSIDHSIEVLKKAQDWIMKDAQNESSKYVETREQKELAYANRGKTVRVTGKTARKKEKLLNRAT
jgi:hypothetical protein